MFQIFVALFIGLASALPVPQAPFLNIKITQGHGAGLQTGFATNVSKQKVSVVKSSLEGESVEEEPFTDHRPPFLALPPVTPPTKLALPARPQYGRQ